jgi:hypothetical protein
MEQGQTMYQGFSIFNEYPLPRSHQKEKDDKLKAF